MATPAQLLAVERGQIGYSRWTDPQPGTIYGRWYAKKTGNPWFGTNGVAFCAMGQSWSFDQVRQAAPGLPTAGCGTIREAARREPAEWSTGEMPAKATSSFSDGTATSTT